jgi:hypothetical protein
MRLVVELDGVEFVERWASMSRTVLRMLLSISRGRSEPQEPEIGRALERAFAELAREMR